MSDEDLEIAIQKSIEDLHMKSQEDAFFSDSKILPSFLHDQTRRKNVDKVSIPKPTYKSDYEYAAALQAEENNLAKNRNDSSEKKASQRIRSNNLSSLYDVKTRPGPSRDLRGGSGKTSLNFDSISGSIKKIVQTIGNPAPLEIKNFCGRCNDPINENSPYINAMDSAFHPDCFHCEGCSRIISGKFVSYGNPLLPYHPNCYQEFYVPKCCLCKGHMMGAYYRCNPMLEPNEVGYCSEHKGPDSKFCFSCNRIEPPSSTGQEGFSVLPDGRRICLECVNTVIVDSAEARPLYLAAVDVMERSLHLPIPDGMRDVPILAVDLACLNEQLNDSKTGKKSYHSAFVEGTPSRGPNGDQDFSQMSITRGLTMSTVGQIRHFSPGGLRWDAVRGCWNLGAPTVTKLEKVREVTAVLVLYGMPRDVTAAILAHEAMHVWFKLSKNMPESLPSQVEEGLCQVVSLLYLNDVETSQLRSRDSSSGSLDWEARLRRYSRYLIETDSSSIYGDGFRKAMKCVNALGLPLLLDYVRDEQRLPIVD